MATRKIFGTQYDDTILVTPTTFSVTSSSTKGKKSATEIYDVSDFTNAVFAGDGKDRIHIVGYSSDAVDGGMGDDLIYGGFENDLLSGGGGRDTIYGGSGNDIIGAVRPGTASGMTTDYVIDLNSDQIGDLLIGDGFDPDTPYGYVGLVPATPGNDVLVGGNGKDTLWGDNWPSTNADTNFGGNDILLGGNGDDSLYGQGGDDVIKGENGNDNIDGGAGDDVIDGGLGADMLKGGAGADRFVYNSALDSTAMSRDIIVDFSPQSEDKIDLRPLLGSTDPEWGGNAPKSYGVWTQVSGTNTLIRIDTTGDALADMVIQLTGTYSLRKSDFLGIRNTAPTLQAVAGITYDDTAGNDSFDDSNGTLSGGDTDFGDTVSYSLSGSIETSESGFDFEKTSDYGTLYLNAISGAYKFVANDGAIEALKTTETVNFSVSAFDGFISSDSQTITVTLNGVNDAPAGSANMELSDGRVNKPYILLASDLLQGFSDAENDTLSAVDLSADHGTIQAFGDGSWTLVPESNYSGVVTLSYQVSDGNGGTVQASQSVNLDPFLVFEYKVNTTTSKNQMYPSIAGLPDGGWVTTWQSFEQDGSGYGIYNQRFDESGYLVGDEIQVNTTTDNDQSEPMVARLIDGGWVTTWSSMIDVEKGVEIFQQRYDVNGNKVDGEVQVNTFNANNQSGQAITALANGGWVICWQSEGQDGSGSGIFQQRYDVNGNKVGTETQVNTSTANDQDDPVITALFSGGWVTSWASKSNNASGYDIFQQIYDANGVAVGSEVRVNGTTNDDQDLLAITALVDGGWVTSWESFDQDGSGYGIYQRRYDANGNEFGSEVKVNTTTANDQSEPAIASLSDGGWVVSWMSWDQDESDWGIYQQRYDSYGIEVGDETKVNIITVDAQSNPALCSIADGGWLVSWMSWGQDGSGWGIYQQRYDKDGTPVAMPLQGNDYANGLVWTGTGSVILDGAGGDDVLTGGPDNDILIGGSGNDVLIGLGGSDDLTGSEGSDRFVFKASDTPEFDDILDFSTAILSEGGDVLDLSELLLNYTPGTAILSDFVQAFVGAGNTHISVDRDGNGTDFELAEYVTLVGVTGIDLNTLLSNGNLVLA